jgi:hypothetical protein
MHIVDRSHQEILTLQKQLSLGLCCLTCKTEVTQILSITVRDDDIDFQKVSVWAPPGDLLGVVKQTFGITKTELQLISANGQILYRIPLPTKMCLGKELHFKVLRVLTS